MTGALRRECAPRGKPQAASGRWQPSCILPLRVARKHFDHIVVQAVVELALEGPRELLIFDFSRPQQELVGVHLDARRPEANFHFDAVRRLVRVKGEERMLVPRQLDLHFFEKLAQDRIAGSSHRAFTRFPQAHPPDRRALSSRRALSRRWPAPWRRRAQSKSLRERSACANARPPHEASRRRTRKADSRRRRFQSPEKRCCACHARPRYARNAPSNRAARAWWYGRPAPCSPHG